MTTDAFVVQPLEFPGGDIGRLAICGTVNDLAVAGANPLGLSLALVIEEGLSLELLDRMIDSIAATAREAGVDDENLRTGLWLKRKFPNAKVMVRGARPSHFAKSVSGVADIEAFWLSQVFHDSMPDEWFI